MNKPSFYHGIAVAFLISFFASALFTALPPMFTSLWLLKVIITLVALAYLIYLLSASSARSGKITTLSLWFVVSGFTWFLTPPQLIFVLIHIGMIWLIRSIYFYKSIVMAIADMGLSVLGLIAAIWAFDSTDSLFLSFWCYFLVQALFVLIPTGLQRPTSKPSTAEQPTNDEAFQRAYRSAEAALRRLN